MWNGEERCAPTERCVLATRMNTHTHTHTSCNCHCWENDTSLRFRLVLLSVEREINATFSTFEVYMRCSIKLIKLLVS